MSDMNNKKISNQQVARELSAMVNAKTTFNTDKEVVIEQVTVLRESIQERINFLKSYKKNLLEKYKGYAQEDYNYHFLKFESVYFSASLRRLEKLIDTKMSPLVSLLTCKDQKKWGEQIDYLKYDLAELNDWLQYVTWNMVDIFIKDKLIRFKKTYNTIEDGYSLLLYDLTLRLILSKDRCKKLGL